MAKTKKRLDQLKAKIKEFEDLQVQYAEFGAADTEPDGEFQAVLINSLSSGNPKIPTGAAGWQLYSTVKGSGKAAAELTKKAREIAEFIGQTPIYEAGEYTEYLHDYCWRIG